MALEARVGFLVVLNRVASLGTGRGALRRPGPPHTRTALRSFESSNTGERTFAVDVSRAPDAKRRLLVGTAPRRSRLRSLRAPSC